MQIVNLVCSFVMPLVSSDKMLGHQLLLKFQSQEERGKVLPFRCISRFKYLHSKCLLGSQLLCVVSSYFGANQGGTDFLWQFLAVQEDDVLRL